MELIYGMNNGDIVVAALFYSALYGINYRLLNVAVWFYSIVRSVVKQGRNHEIARIMM